VINFNIVMMKFMVIMTKFMVITMKFMVITMKFMVVTMKFMVVTMKFMVVMMKFMIVMMKFMIVMMKFMVAVMKFIIVRVNFGYTIFIFTAIGMSFNVTTYIVIPGGWNLYLPILVFSPARVVFTPVASCCPCAAVIVAGIKACSKTSARGGDGALNLRWYYTLRESCRRGSSGRGEW